VGIILLGLRENISYVFGGGVLTVRMYGSLIIHLYLRYIKVNKMIKEIVVENPNNPDEIKAAIQAFEIQRGKVSNAGNISIER